MTAKDQLNSAGHKKKEKKTRKKRPAGTWIGVTMLIGMGLLCSAGAVGGIALAITAMATNPGMAFGGLMMSAATGYVLPYLVEGINTLLDPEAAAEKREQKLKLKTTGPVK